MAEIKYWDAKFTKDEANEKYNTLLNIEPVAPPYDGIGIRDRLHMLRGDKGQYFMNTRQGFKVVDTYGRDGQKELDTPEWTEGTFTDMREFMGERYFLRTNRDKTRIRLYQQKLTNKQRCSQGTIEDIDDGIIQNISYDFENEKDYFGFTPCTYDRMIITSHVTGNKKTPSFFNYSITAVYRGGQYYYLLYGNTEEWTSNISAGDYIYIEEWGQVVLAGEKISDSTLESFVNTPPYAIFLVGSLANYMNLTNEDGSPAEIKTITSINIEVYDSYGPTISFLTDNGLITAHGLEDLESQTSFNYSYSSDTTNRDVVYTGATTRGNSLVLIDSSGVMLVGGEGFDKFSFPASMRVDTSGVYTNVVEFLGYIILIGPHEMAYYNLDRNSLIGSMMKISQDSGYFNPGSFRVKDSNFFIVRNSNDFYGLSVEGVYGQSLPNWIFTYMNSYLQSHLSPLHSAYDTVNIDMTDNKTYIIINNNATDNSKILIQNRYYNVWYQWICSNVRIHRCVDGIFFGKHIYKQTGNTDNGNEIISQISMLFGDVGLSVSKNFSYIKMNIGMDGIYTNDTKIITGTLSSGLYQEASTIFSSGRYPNLLLNKSSTDIINSYPTGGIIYGMGKLAKHTLANEFMLYDNLATSTYNADADDDTYMLSEYSPIEIPLTKEGEIIQVTLLSRGKDKISCGGFFLGYYDMDYDFADIEDTLVYRTDYTYNSSFK